MRLNVKILKDALSKFQNGEIYSIDQFNNLFGYTKSCFYIISVYELTFFEKEREDIRKYMDSGNNECLVFDVNENTHWESTAKFEDLLNIIKDIDDETPIVEMSIWDDVYWYYTTEFEIKEMDINGNKKLILLFNKKRFE